MFQHLQAPVQRLDCKRLHPNHLHRAEIAMAAPKIDYDAKKGEVRSADLGVNYDGQIAVVNKELAQMQSMNGRVIRALKDLGVTTLKMNDNDLKKVAAYSNAAALVKELSELRSEITGIPLAWWTAETNMDKAEDAAREKLFDEVAKDIADDMRKRQKEIDDAAEELRKLKEKREGLLAEITMKTKAARDAFDKKFSKVYDEGQELVDAYKQFNIQDVLKHIKKR